MADTASSLYPNGGVAQLGEHLPCKQGVMGSNPIISTRSARADKQSQFAAQIEDRVWEKDGNWKHTWKYGLIAQQVRARA